LVLGNLILGTRSRILFFQELELVFFKNWNQNHSSFFLITGTGTTLIYLLEPNWRFFEKVKNCPTLVSPAIFVVG
jgi:hypothetical protein